jgi:anti-sigma B factor antagonist
MNIFTTRHADTLILTLNGRLDREGTRALQDALHAAYTSEAKHIILDMGGVHFINSLGLRLLADTLSHLHATHGSLKLVGLSRGVETAMRTVGFQPHFPLYPTLGAALAS